MTALTPAEASAVCRVLADRLDDIVESDEPPTSPDEFDLLLSASSKLSRIIRADLLTPRTPPECEKTNGL